MDKSKKTKSKNSNTKESEVSIRDGFGKGFVEAGRTNPLVVGLTADLTESVRMGDFAKEYPDRFTQIGIAEQNMAAVAAGLAMAGKIPFAGSFAAFQPYRNLDQIRTSICIQNLPVKLVSSHAGFSYGADGVQVQALEDVGIMRMLPNMTVLVPADADQAEQMTVKAVGIPGPVYLRLGREKTLLLSAYPEVDKSVLDLQIGKAQILTKGTDVAIVACGYMVGQALLVSRNLAEQGIYATVVNMHTIKPIDVEMLNDLVGYVGRIVCVEEHQVAGGLGSAVVEEIIRNKFVRKDGSSPRLKLIGVQDRFGDTAKTTKELWEAYGLGVREIENGVKELLN